jgi:hypothetical protein
MAGKSTSDIRPAEVQAMCVIARLVEKRAATRGALVGVTVAEVEGRMRRGSNNVQRWMQRLARLGLLRVLGRVGVHRLYAPTPAWGAVACALAAAGRLLGYCEVGGCPELAEPFRFGGRHLCREHIMSAEGRFLEGEDGDG